MADLLTNGAMSERVQVVTTSITPLAYLTTSPTLTRFIGSSSQTVVLPDATTLFKGMRYVFANRSTGVITVQDASLATLATIASGKEKEFRVYDNGTLAGTWDITTADEESNAIPLRMYASTPATAVLSIGPSLVQRSDGAGITISPVTTVIPDVLLSTINFQTGAITGTVTNGVGGPALTFPTSTIGYYRRLAFSAQADGSIAASFSSEFPLLTSVPNGGTLLTPLVGRAIGYIDLQATAATAFKTADSATNIIETSVSGSPRIFQILGGGGGSAAGSDTQIQYNSALSFGGSAAFTWDYTNNILSLNGLLIDALSSGFTLVDNQVTPATVFSLPHASNRNIVVEYSIVRNGTYHMGRLQIINDGTSAFITNDDVSTASIGITFSVTISGANVLLQYTSTSTGFSGTMKYSRRRWI